MRDVFVSSITLRDTSCSVAINVSAPFLHNVDMKFTPKPGPPGILVQKL